MPSIHHPWLLLAAVLLLPALALAAVPDPNSLPARPELTDPLTLVSGGAVTRLDQWELERKPELRRLFQEYMYGHFPTRPGTVEADVTFEDPSALGGEAVVREVELRFGLPGMRPVRLLVVAPRHRKGRVPVFVGPNFCGNHALLDDERISLPQGWMYPKYPGVEDNRATNAGRGKQFDVWNLDLAVSRGYGVATFYNGDVEPDVAGAKDGIRAQYPKADWGAIAAWSWGISRAVDYLRLCPEFDPERIIAVGHSRNGKAAIVAAAFDERIALAIPHQAGCGGTAPSRGTVGESVERINTSFPHWFNARFKQFNRQPERLPFDQNCLVALMAPRPVLFSNAVEDTWANPAGQFEVLRGADPVYRLHGVRGLEYDVMPEPGRLLFGRLGYYIRPGKHSMTRQDWHAFLDFADRQLPAARR